MQVEYIIYLIQVWQGDIQWPSQAAVLCCGTLHHVNVLHFIVCGISNSLFYCQNHKLQSKCIHCLACLSGERKGVSLAANQLIADLSQDGDSEYI